MVLTKEHLEAIAEAALPIEYGTIVIHIGAASRYLEMDVVNKVRVPKEPTAKEAQKPIMKIKKTA